MTIAVDLGRKATKQTKSKCNWLYLIVSDMAKHHLENAALRTFYETLVF